MEKARQENGYVVSEMAILTFREIMRIQSSCDK